MNGRLERKDYIIVFIIVTLVLSFTTGFLLGGSVMKNRVITHYEAVIEEMKQGDTGDTSYPETDFTRFYHVILSPYQQFEKEYLQFRNHLLLPSTQIDLLAEAADLKELAGQILKEMKTIQFADHSPRLQEALEQYWTAMEQYELAFASTFKQELKEIKNQFLTLTNTQQADAAALRGQTLFYHGIMIWETIQRPYLAALEEQDWRSISFGTWTGLSANQKNYVIASILEQEGLLSPYQPEDLTYHLDHFLRSATEEELKKHSLLELVLMFHKSDAVNQGQFRAHRSELYPDEIFPLIPLFW